MITKKCTICEEYKELDKFFNHKNMKYGKYSSCKICTSAKRREEYKNNSEKIKKRTALYFLKNKERVYASKRIYLSDPVKKEMRKKYCSKYTKKIVSGLEDAYIRYLVSVKLKIKQRDVPECLIDLWRLNLLLKRESKYLTEKESYNYGNRKY